MSRGSASAQTMEAEPPDMRYQAEPGNEYNMQDKYRRKITPVTLIRYHFVWIPARRKKVLVGGVSERLKQLLTDKCIELECSIVTMEIMPDYVHLLVDAPPNLAPHQIMFRLKGFTSFQLRKEYPHLKKIPALLNTGMN